MVPLEPKKSVIESLAALVSALGGARTPISELLVELGFFLGLVYGAIWAYEHTGPAAKPWLEIVFVLFGVFIGFALLFRVLSVTTTILKDTRKH